MMPNFKASVPVRLSDEPFVSLDVLMRPHWRGNSGVCGGGGWRGARLIAGLQLCVLYEDPSHVVQPLAVVISNN